MIVVALIVGVAAASSSLDGGALVERFQCGRCHETGPIVVEPTDRHCVSCHRRVGPPGLASPFDGGLGASGLGDLGGPGFGIRGRGERRLPGTVIHLRELPSLHVAGRLRAAWVASFLQQPHRSDVRRGLGESMPRLAITPEEANAIAEHITSGTAPPDVDAGGKLAAGDVARGLTVLEAKGCGTCHAFTGSPRVLVARALPALKDGSAVDGATLVRGMSLAPDLRYTRERTTRAHVRRVLDGYGLTNMPLFLEADRGLRIMPDIPMSDGEKNDVIAALFDAKLSPPKIGAVPERLKPLERRVAFDEVRERVFSKTCIHCHADDSLDLGVGGPGNSGGFGYPGTGLVLTGYARVMAGSPRPVGGEAKRKSIFRPVESGPLTGVPLLVAQLRARQVEEAGGEIEGVVGMPLGLPALSAEELQLVETWVAQGRPQ